MGGKLELLKLPEMADTIGSSNEDKKLLRRIFRGGASFNESNSRSVVVVAWAA
jgi:hypothetical protein